MYHLISGLFTSLTKIDEYNVVIIGLDNSGKSTFLEAVKRKFIEGYKGMDLKYIPPTIGLNLGQIQISQRLNFFDLGGHKDLQHIWSNYYDEAHAIIFMIDSCERGRINECKEILRNVLNDEKTYRIPVLLLANKQDISDCMSVDHIKVIFQDHQSVVPRHFEVFGVSGIRGKGIEESIKCLCQILSQHSTAKPSIIQL